LRLSHIRFDSRALAPMNRADVPACKVQQVPQNRALNCLGMIFSENRHPLFGIML
jgi:hypothetical protein